MLDHYQYEDSVVMQNIYCKKEVNEVGPNDIIKELQLISIVGRQSRMKGMKRNELSLKVLKDFLPELLRTLCQPGEGIVFFTQKKVYDLDPKEDLRKNGCNFFTMASQDI